MITCLECGETVKNVTWTHLKRCCGLTPTQYKQKHPDAPLITNETISKMGVSKEKMILRHGEEEGLRRWNVYVEKQRYSNSFEYKREKHEWSEETFHSFNKSRAITLENLTIKNGEEEGLRRWNVYVEKQRHAGCKEQYFIEKLGEEEGRLFYKELNKRKGKPFEYFFSKAKGDYNLALKLLENDRSKTYRCVSKSSKIFFDEMVKTLNIPQSSLRYEFGKMNKETKKYYFYDLVDIDRKVCFEYNGDLFHANPSKYLPSDIPRFRGNKRTALEIWKYDEEKHRTIVEHGFRLIIIWDSDAKKNLQAEIERVKELYENSGN